MAFGYELTVAKSGVKMTVTGDSGRPLISGVGPSAIKAERVPMSLFASFLGYRLHVSVVDKTGLKDRFNFEMNWASEADPDHEGYIPPGRCPSN